MLKYPWVALIKVLKFNHKLTHKYYVNLRLNQELPCKYYVNLSVGVDLREPFLYKPIFKSIPFLIIK